MSNSRSLPSKSKPTRSRRRLLITTAVLFVVSISFTIAVNITGNVSSTDYGTKVINGYIMMWPVNVLVLDTPVDNTATTFHHTEVFTAYWYLNGFCGSHERMKYGLSSFDCMESGPKTGFDGDNLNQKFKQYVNWMLAYDNASSVYVHPPIGFAPNATTSAQEVFTHFSIGKYYRPSTIFPLFLISIIWPCMVCAQHILLEFTNKFTRYGNKLRYINVAFLVLSSAASTLAAKLACDSASMMVASATSRVASSSAVDYGNVTGGQLFQALVGGAATCQCIGALLFGVAEWVRQRQGTTTVGNDGDDDTTSMTEARLVRTTDTRSTEETAPSESSQATVRQDIEMAEVYDDAVDGHPHSEIHDQPPPYEANSSAPRGRISIGQFATVVDGFNPKTGHSTPQYGQTGGSSSTSRDNFSAANTEDFTIPVADGFQSVQNLTPESHQVIPYDVLTRRQGQGDIPREKK